MIYTVKNNQNIFDIAIHLYGSVEGVYDLLISNENLGMSTELKAGQELVYHESFVINKPIVDKISSENYLPANGERHVYAKRSDKKLAIKFIVSPAAEHASIKMIGSGDIDIDWGDNRDIETITLSNSLQDIDHYFDNTVEYREIKMYGDFSLTKFDVSEMPGIMYLMRPVNVEEYVNNENVLTLTSLLLCVDTYRVDLSRSEITDLSPIKDMSLQELILKDVKFKSVSVLDDYLEYISTHYGDRSACVVELSEMPSERGMNAINTIIGESEWNTPVKWKFIINENIIQSNV